MKIGVSRRIHVLRLVGRIVLRRELGLARRERDDAALVVADGDHEAPAKPRAERADRDHRVVADEEEPALAERLLGVLFPHDCGPQAAAIRRRGADLEFLGQFRGEAALVHPVRAHEVARGSRRAERLVEMARRGAREGRRDSCRSERSSLVGPPPSSYSIATP